MSPHVLFFAAGAFVIAAGSASAQDRLIGRFIDPKRACFVAIHAAETMAARPGLTVSAIGFRARVGDEPVPEGHDMAATLALRLVGQDERLRTDVLCRESETEAAVTCVLPGKGGSFTLRPLTNGDLRLTVNAAGLMPEGAAIRVPGDAGPNSVFDLIRAGEMMCS
jgi:hypothetical protein